MIDPEETNTKSTKDVLPQTFNFVSEDAVSSSVKFYEPHSYDWKPTPDITTYELALVLPFFLMVSRHWSFDADKYWENLPDNVRRHIPRVKD
jgi:hypothetical protein